MKNGKRPTRKQAIFIKMHGLNWENWLVVKDTPTMMELVHRHSDRTVRTIYKETKNGNQAFDRTGL